MELDFICTNCIHRVVEDFTCPAFPDGIPLRPGQTPLLHDEVLPNQEGTTVYEGDGSVKASNTYRALKLTQDERDAGQAERQ